MTEPRVSFSAGVDRDAAIDEAMTVFQREGMVVIDDVIDPAHLARCLAEIETVYPDYAKPDRQRNFGPYTGRHTMPLRIDGVLADPPVFLPRTIEKLAARLLGAKFLIDGFGLLVATPDAPEQKRHADATLFNPLIDRVLPPFAVALAIPLVTMDESTGRTAFWRKSHRSEPAAAYDYAPTVSPGSVLLWDYRTAHCGLANLTDRPRPVLFVTLSREWWVELEPPEATLYEKLQMTRTAQEALRPRLRYRLNRAKLFD